MGSWAHHDATAELSRSYCLPQALRLILACPPTTGRCQAPTAEGESLRKPSINARLHGETGQVLMGSPSSVWLGGGSAWPQRLWPSSSSRALKGGMGFPVPTCPSPDAKAPSCAFPSSLPPLAFLSCMLSPLPNHTNSVTVETPVMNS